MDRADERLRVVSTEYWLPESLLDQSGRVRRDPIPYASGAFNQRCYIDVARKTVLVKFSSLPLLGSDETQGDNPPEADDIAVQSFLELLPELVR